MSDKVRVYEIAEEAGASSSEVILKAKDLRFNLKSPQSALSYEDAEELANYLMTGKSSRLKEKISNKDSSLKTKDISPSKPKVNSNRAKKKPQVTLNEIKKSFNKKTKNNKKEKIELIKFPNIKIKINNLKTINNFSWEINDKQSVYVIIGENGIGKSSILISLAKLVKPTIFKEELSGKGFEDTIISYQIDEHSINWVKDPYWKQIELDSYEMPKLNGFLESSVLTGTRFKYIDKYMRETLEVRPDEDTINDANDFIKNNMNYILNGTNGNNKFDNLYDITAVRKRQMNRENDKQFINKTYTFYALKQKNTYVKEFFFSTGEYFLLSLLKFIHINKSNKSAIPPLIIIDEIELSLHPLAQQRLIEKIYEFCDEFNLLIIFATHSLQIIENTRPEHLYYLKKGVVSNNHTISNPIYPGYLTTRLYDHKYLDRILLVEDNCALHFLKMVIKQLKLGKMNLHHEIIPIGDFKKVLDTARDNLTSRFYGNADVIAIVDEDKKSECDSDKYKQIRTSFIPIEDNIEKYIITRLHNRDDELIDYIEEIICPCTYDDIALDIQSLEKSRHIKNAFKALIAAISDLGSRTNAEITTYEAEKEIVKYIFDNIQEKSEFKKFCGQINKFFNQ